MNDDGTSSAVACCTVRRVERTTVSGNFFIQVFQSALQLATALIGLRIVFAYTATIGGWSRPELLAQLGVYLLVGGLINLVLQPSMQQLIADVHDGALDFTLLKPRDAQLLVSVRQVQLWRSVDVLLGSSVVAVALMQGDIVVSVAPLLLFAATLVAGMAIIYSVWLMLSTCAFWARAENLLVVFGDMYEAGRWPVTIYPVWLRLALTFLVPVAFATTVPAEALVGRLTLPTLLSAIGAALALLVLARWFWRRSLRRYAGASA